MNQYVKRLLRTVAKRSVHQLWPGESWWERVARKRRRRKAKAALLGGAALAGAVALPLVLLSPQRARAEKRAPFYGRNFAHRGLHQPDQTVPENSLAAFRLAVEKGYGIELDVQLSSDGDVVVFHDDDLKRLCGVDSPVSALTGSQLRKLRLCGTEETIPLFSQVLELVAGRVPLIVELKSGNRNRELCKKTCALLRTYRGSACIESFDPFIVGWFRIHGKEFLRGQLAMPQEFYVRAGRSPYAAKLLSHTLLNMVGRPNFIAYQVGKRPLTVRIAEGLGAMRFGWTAHDPSAEKHRDAVIFEYYKPAVRYK